MQRLITLFGALVLVYASLVQAERLSGGAGFAGPGPAGPHVGGVLEQLLYPCRAACNATARDCGDMQEDTAVSCIDAACSAQIAAAQAACASDNASQACRSAASALSACSQSCLTTFRTAVIGCHDARAACLITCSNS